MSVPYSSEPLPPPRWKARRGMTGCGKTALIVGVSVFGLMAAGCCCWTGLVHSTLEDVAGRSGGWQELSREPAQPPWMGVEAREQPTTSRDKLPVRRGLLPADEVEARESAREAPPPGTAPEDRPARRPAEPDEGEIFGF